MSATSEQCQGPNPQRYIDINLCFSTYIYCWGPVTAPNPTTRLFLQSLRYTYIKACASLYTENNSPSALGSPDVNGSIPTSRTFLICCAAMFHSIPWIMRRHGHLAVNCTKRGLGPAQRWTPKCRCHTQVQTLREFTWALLTINGVQYSCSAHPNTGTSIWLAQQT